MAGLVQITNSTIDKLLANPEVTKSIPCLAMSLETVEEKGCGSCGGKRRRVKRANYSRAKKCIGALSKTPVALLRKVLGADSLRITYVAGGHKVVKTLR